MIKIKAELEINRKITILAQEVVSLQIVLVSNHASIVKFELITHIFVL